MTAPRFIAQYDASQRAWRVACTMTGLWTRSGYTTEAAAENFADACELWHSLIERKVGAIRYPCPACNANGMMPNGERCPRCDGACYDFQPVEEHDAAYGGRERSHGSDTY